MKNAYNEIRRIEYFDFLKAFFGDQNKYNLITNSEKERHFFMLMRVLSRKDPIAIHEYRDIKHWSVIDHLQKAFYCGRQPNWSYGGDSGKGKKGLWDKYDEKVLNQVMNITGYEFKAIKSLCNMLPDIAKEIFDEAKSQVIQKPKKSRK